MPVSSVSRSQTKTVNSPKNFALGFTFLRKVSKGEFVVSELLAGIKGAVLGESSPEQEGIERGGGVGIDFTPSHLRTIYILQDILVQLPPLIFAAELENPGESEIEIGYLVQLKVAGETVLAESVGNEVLKSTSFAKFQLFTSNPPTNKQVQLQQEIRVPSGVSLEVVVTAYYRIISVTEPKFNLFVLGLLGGPQKMRFQATIVYQQQFPNKG